MAETVTASGKDHPYKPSLIDRLNDWVGELRMGSVTFYLLLGIVLILIQLLFLWYDGGKHADELLPIITFNALAIPFVLGLIRILDSQAVSALNSMKPVLDLTEAEFDRYEYELSNMRSRVPIALGLGLAVSVVLMEQAWIEPVRYAALRELPVFAGAYHIIDKATAFFMGVYVYHTVRQLRFVYAINTSRIRINLFNLGPLQAFSRLTALTALGLVVGIYGWMLINPELLMDPFTAVFVTVFTMLAIAVFVLPLYGVHRLLETAKARELQEVDLRFERVFSKFNERFREDDYSEIEKLNRTISSLEIQHKRVEAIDTWPWGTESIRFALSVISLPLVLTLLRFLIEEMIGW
jgi:hypothetical protein